MGGAWSEEDTVAELPQQVILQLDQGQPLEAPSSAQGLPRLGTTKQCQAVRPNVVLEGDPILEPDALVVPLRATAPGLLTALSGPVEPGAWPRLPCERWRTEVPVGTQRLRLPVGPGVTALLLEPGGGSYLDSLELPQDGTLLVLLEPSRLRVRRQLVANRGEAFELQELFGLQAQQDEGEGGCVICLTRPKSTALLPCRHFCCCHDCAVALRLRPSGNRCPLCRREVADLLRLDMEPLAPSPPNEAPAADPVQSTSTSGSADTLPSRTLQRLGRELQQLQRREAQLRAEHGLELFLSDEADLRLWTLRLHREGLGSSRLAAELARWDVAYVELELWIPESFPTAPPQARVLRPCFRRGSFWVQDQGALCMEVLTSHGWSPGLSLAQLGLQIASVFMQGSGSLAGTGLMAEPGAAARERAFQVSMSIERAHRDWERP